MKILYFDTETTGVNPKVNEIIQFAAIAEIDGKIQGELNVKCQPTDWNNIDQTSLEITGLTIDILKTYERPSVCGEKIRQFLSRFVNKYDREDKFYPAGHNISFDLDFLQSFWKKHVDEYGIGSYQNWRALDSRVFANFLSVKNKLPCQDMKLGTICKFYGIDISAHDAMSDIRATRILIRKMLELV